MSDDRCEPEVTGFAARVEAKLREHASAPKPAGMSDDVKALIAEADKIIEQMREPHDERGASAVFRQMRAALEASVQAPAADKKLEEALDVLAHIVSQATVNPVVDKDDWVVRYDMPVGSIHKAIPLLQRYGIAVDIYGYIHKPSTTTTGESE